MSIASTLVGLLKPSVWGSVADWVTGGFTGASILMAIHAIRVESERPRRAQAAAVSSSMSCAPDSAAEQLATARLGRRPVEVRTEICLLNDGSIPISHLRVWLAYDSRLGRSEPPTVVRTISGEPFDMIRAGSSASIAVSILISSRAQHPAMAKVCAEWTDVWGLSRRSVGNVLVDRRRSRRPRSVDDQILGVPSQCS